MSKKWLFVISGVVLACGTMSAAFLKLNKTPFLQKENRETSERAEGRNPALIKHLEQIEKAIPGNGGESDMGPGGYADQKLMAMAYPSKDIDLARITGARASFEAIKNRTTFAPEVVGTWESVGPTKAQVPNFGLRDATAYTPKKYFAGGRTTCMVISPTCTNQSCRLWIGAAGGGIWRTDKALAKSPKWDYLAAPFAINSIGSIALDPNDVAHNTIWAGTGEGNASGDSVFGVGLYKSTDGGNTWTGPFGQTEFSGRATATIAVKTGDSNVIYAGSVRATNGVSAVSGGGTTILVPGAAIWGLYKSTDGGTNWTLVHNGAPDVVGCTDPATVASNGTQCSPRGVREVRIDPTDPAVVYASSFARGVWRSPDEGASWTQILAPLNAASNVDRSAMALNTLGNGDTRMYVGEGHTSAGGQYSRLFRSDSVRTGTPTFTDLTSASTADPGYGSFDYCTGQCWYDNFVYSPPGFPDMVYLGGALQYDENDPFPNVPWISNGRGVVLSQNAGVSWTDLTYDSTSFLHPMGLHPDNHILVTNPNNPLQFFEGNDGGVWRSNGTLKNVSNFCNGRSLTGTDLTQCQQLLSGVPTKISAISKGLNTLQFQSLSVNPFDSKNLQGGTQDNGTWETKKSKVKWTNSMIGDGGQSGFDVSDKNLRFHTYFVGQVDINFTGGKVADWNWAADPWFIAGEAGVASFYIPIINDPVVGKTIYAGLLHAWRTKTYGLGTMTIAQYRQHCNEWTGDFAVACGDWEPLGDPAATGQLTDAGFGDRAGGFVTSVERTVADSNTLWAATSGGRIFVSKNADAVPASGVTFVRIDGLSALDPARFPTSIFVDPANANHAWVTYSGFSANTPTTPGHVFEITYDPIGVTATFTIIDGSGAGSLGDLPISDIALDQTTGDLYISTDFGVLRDASAAGIDWQLAAPGMPNVETVGLTIVSADRKLYAATHGRGAWLLELP